MPLAFPWPPGFARVPDEPWTGHPVDAMALGYDSVDQHGWYANLDPVVEALSGFLRDGRVLVDYSGGTGILARRLLRALPEESFGLLIVDASPKFLRLALEKVGHDPRVAFRVLHFLAEAKRLQTLAESLGPPWEERGVDGLVSTNAIHLYSGVQETLDGWAQMVKPGGKLWVQSGNIARDNPGGPWIIDGTIEAVRQAAEAIVRAEPRFAAHRGLLDDPARRAAYQDHFRRYFPAARSLAFYVDALQATGFALEGISHRILRPRAKEWLAFLSVYHEGILGWVGGVEKLEGKPASDAAVRDRLALLELALDRALGGRDRFEAEWTYLSAGRV